MSKRIRRADFFIRAKAQKREIEQIFADCDYWNEHVRKPNEERIDCDPDGTLRSCLAYCDGILNGEVYIAPERGPAR